jgi:hypothetical protein
VVKTLNFRKVFALQKDAVSEQQGTVSLTAVPVAGLSSWLGLRMRAEFLWANCHTRSKENIKIDHREIGFDDGR